MHFKILIKKSVVKFGNRNFKCIEDLLGKRFMIETFFVTLSTRYRRIWSKSFENFIKSITKLSRLEQSLILNYFWNPVCQSHPLENLRVNKYLTLQFHTYLWLIQVFSWCCCETPISTVIFVFIINYHKCKVNLSHEDSIYGYSSKTFSESLFLVISLHAWMLEGNGMSGKNGVGIFNDG